MSQSSTVSRMRADCIRLCRGGLRRGSRADAAPGSEHRARRASGLEAAIALRALPQVVARIERPEALDALEPAARAAGQTGVLGPVGPAAAAAVEPAPRRDPPAAAPLFSPAGASAAGSGTCPRCTQMSLCRGSIRLHNRPLRHDRFARLHGICDSSQAAEPRRRPSASEHPTRRLTPCTNSMAISREMHVSKCLHQLARRI